MSVLLQTKHFFERKSYALGVSLALYLSEGDAGVVAAEAEGVGDGYG